MTFKEEIQESLNNVVNFAARKPIAKALQMAYEKGRTDMYNECYKNKKSILNRHKEQEDPHRPLNVDEVAMQQEFLNRRHA